MFDFMDLYLSKTKNDYFVFTPNYTSNNSPSKYSALDRSSVDLTICTRKRDTPERKH